MWLEDVYLKAGMEVSFGEWRCPQKGHSVLSVWEEVRMWMGSDGSRCAGSGVMRYLDLQGQLVLACEREASAMDKEILDTDPLSHAHSWSES